MLLEVLVEYSISSFKVCLSYMTFSWSLCYLNFSVHVHNFLVLGTLCLVY
jgi:hypothetical protein